MTRTKKLALSALVAFALAAGAVSFAPQVAGDPSQWGVAKKGSFDITELEQLAGGKDPEIPTLPGILAGGKDPEIPSTPGILAGGKDPEYPTTPGILAGGKDPEIPVMTGLA